MLKCRIYQRQPRPTKYEELIEAIREEWDALVPDECKVHSEYAGTRVGRPSSEWRTDEILGSSRRSGTDPNSFISSTGQREYQRPYYCTFKAASPYKTWQANGHPGS
jgi:hypothetical protein